MAPYVSIISIARTEHELVPLENLLKQQSFQDFEFVKGIGGSIPNAWNRAIERAQGEIFVFLESDATPTNQFWLQELVDEVSDEKTIVKGLEVTTSIWDLANLATHRNAFKQVRFDEGFLVAEDTELFCHLNQQGFRFHMANTAPVVHFREPGTKRVKRAFRYGMYWVKIKYRYGKYSDFVRLDSIFAYLRDMFLEALLGLLGLAIGTIIYFPEYIQRVRRKTPK